MPEHDTLDHSTEVASAINSATSKTPPVDADELGLIDSAASNVLKKLTWANLKAAIKSYLEGLASISFTGTISSSGDTIKAATPTLTLKDSDCTDDDANATIYAAATDTGSGSEDVDVYFKQQIAGTLTTYLHVDADGDIDFQDRDITTTGSVSAGTTLNVAGVDIARHMLMGRNVKYYSAQHLFTQAAVSGSGVTFIPSTTRYAEVSSGSTPGSTALRYSGANNGIWSRNTDDGTVKWSKVRLVVFPFYRVTATANGKTWGFWGTPSTGHPTNTDPSTAGIGFRVDNAALKGIVHNGTSLTVVDLGVTLSYLGMRELAIVLDGSGNIYWYVDGVLSGQSDQAPIVNGVSGNNCFGIWTTNGADSAAQNLRMHDIRIWVEE